MNRFKCLALTVALGICTATSAPKSEAQISINIGPAPVCPYGYYDVPPYSCAPYGYYGSEWFRGGAFIGAGPWFHGPAHFYGHVDNHFHPDHGYHGPVPNHDERPRADWHGAPANFHGNEYRDGHGHVDEHRH
jgi:hypothetical protein